MVYIVWSQPMSSKNSMSAATKKRLPAPSGTAATAVTVPATPLPRGSGAGPAQPADGKEAAKKPAAPAALKRPVDAAKPLAEGKAAGKSPKPRPQLVRDSFTMPEADFAVIAALKSRALGARRAAKKSELLRAGLRSLAALDVKALVAALDRLEPVKTGRPKKGH
jgi:hypothetical protein